MSCRGRLGWIVCCVDRERGSKASQKLHQVAGECKKKKARDRLDRSSKWHAIVWTARPNGTRSFGPRVQIASPFLWSLGNYYTTCKLLKMIAGTDMCQRGDPLANLAANWIGFDIKILHCNHPSWRLTTFSRQTKFSFGKINLFHYWWSLTPSSRHLSNACLVIARKRKTERAVKARRSHHHREYRR